MSQTFFYDDQIRRFLLQFARLMSNFQVEYGKDSAGNTALLRVPVRYGDSSRQAQSVLQNNSPSSLPSVPLITFYISDMQYDRSRIQEPYFVSKTHVRQRFYDSESDTFETTQGNAFTIERLMPVPYKMTVTCDFWTSNTTQKFQLFEQIAPLFNPALEIQSTDSYLDWTSLSVVELDTNSWTSRTIPAGTEEQIDIMSMRFNIPIWISSPAKVKKLGAVNKIIMSVFDAKGDPHDAILNDDLLLGTRQKFTPYNYQVLLIGNKVQILKPSAAVNPTNNNTTPQQPQSSNETWPGIVAMYGTLRPGISQVRLDDQWGGNSIIIGTVTFDPTDDRFLLFSPDVDTLPQNTLSPINAVIDPLVSGPGAGLPNATAGQRYLILEDVGDADATLGSAAWGNVVAYANDIIEYNGTQWQQVFDASSSTNVQFVTNLTTQLQYRWTGSNWVKSYEGLYPAGEWSIVL